MRCILTAWESTSQFRTTDRVLVLSTTGIVIRTGRTDSSCTTSLVTLKNAVLTTICCIYINTIFHQIIVGTSPTPIKQIIQSEPSKVFSVVILSTLSYSGSILSTTSPNVLQSGKLPEESELSSLLESYPGGCLGQSVTLSVTLSVCPNFSLKIKVKMSLSALCGSRD